MGGARTSAASVQDDVVHANLEGELYVVFDMVG